MARKVPVLHPLWSWLQTRYTLLLLSQLVVFVVYPFFMDTAVGVLLMGGFISATIVAGAASLDAAYRRTGWVLAVPTLALVWLAVGSMREGAMLAACSVGLASVGYQVARIFGNSLAIERVSLEKVQGSLVVYFLIGLLFALVYTILETEHAGSFAIGEPPELIPIAARARGIPEHILGFSHLLFHSYMTLCATSYGGVAAQTPPALAFSALETLIGQLYLAVLVSQLMGLHIAFSTGSRSR